MSTLTFGIIGGGWRADFFLRIARDLPQRFPFAGIVIRDPAKRAASERIWALPHFASTEELLEKSAPAFVVTSVPWAANYPLIEKLVGFGIPILSETPIAPTIDEMNKTCGLVQTGAKIQVAEQYLFQPAHAARLSVIAAGLLGTVHEATVSVAHGYHGISLLRHYLGAGLRQPVITAKSFSAPLVEGPDRNGPPTEYRTKASERVLATLDYGDRLGIYDFSGDQYFSWIRSHYVNARGEKGEIAWETVRYLADFRTPMQFDLVRRDSGQGGNLEGHALESIQGNGTLWYRNSFAPARWSDDEIAVATSLEKMQRYIATGEPFYSVAEACQDRYLDLLIEEAKRSGQAVTAEPQAWS